MPSDAAGGAPDSAPLPFAVGAAELARWRAAGACRLLDVRESWELDICRFPGARHIPLGELPARLDEVPDDRPVVVVCHHGVRSAQAVGFLRRRGVPGAVNLKGGIDAWARAVDPAMAVY